MSGTLTLAGNNTFTGPTTVNSGILQIVSGGAAGSIAATSSITGSSGATVVFNSSGNYGGSYAAAITRGLALTQAGSGTLTLTGNNTYTGTTSVTGGELRIGGGGSSGAVASTSLLLGRGRLVLDRSDAFTETFTNTVVTGGASVAANANNTLNLGSLTMQPGGSLAIAATGTFITSSVLWPARLPPASITTSPR